MIGQAVSQERSRVNILGVSVDRLTMDETVARVEEFILSKEPHMVVTADSSGIVAAQSDSEFLEILTVADLVTPDSVGVIWAAKRKGQPIPERVSGVDLFYRICQKSADRGYRIYLLGAAHGVADLAAEKLRLQFPGCNIVGARHGYFPVESDEVVAQEVAECKPDILFVAMGIPRQEKFIYHSKDIIRASVAIGVGGTLDVVSGNVKRAPIAIQKMRMEWLWRLILNPRKWEKARKLPVFVKLVLRARD